MKILLMEIYGKFNLVIQKLLLNNLKIQLLIEKMLIFKLRLLTFYFINF